MRTGQVFRCYLEPQDAREADWLDPTIGACVP